MLFLRSTRSCSHVEATPTFFINGKRLTGAPNVEEMRRTIAAAIAGQ
ncbi:DsbA family protein [Sinorhizobium psoraleae]